MKIKSVIAMLLLVLIFCTPYQFTKEAHSERTPIDESILPIDVSAKNYPLFSVARIESALLPGTPIGAHHDGLLHFKQFYHYASGVVSDQAEKRYKKIIAEELGRSGYNIVEQSDLFGDDQSWRARLLIGASIIDAKLNTFGTLAGDYSEAELKIEWQIYDKEYRTIVYDTSLSGSRKLSGVVSEIGFEAFRISFQRLLSCDDYISALDTHLNAKTSQAIVPSNVQYHKGYTSPISNCVEYACKAVIALKTGAGHGSGFIINSDGYALTNYHVVEGVNMIDAIMHDGKIIQTRVISTQPDIDLALIKLSGSGYDYLAFGDINQTAVGSTVHAIGAPVLLELAQSVSRGIVSGYRTSQKYTLVQTDATVNPGNSGGPLIDETGKVIGIVALKIPLQYGIEGLGFGISINDAIESFGLRVAE